MKNILVEMHCIQCGYHTHIKSHTLLLPELEPNLRQRLLNGELFSYTCPRCHQVIEFQHPFLYHDKQHRFLIFMSKEEKDMNELQEQFPLTKIRLVRNAYQLVEKIRIWEDGLDDRVIELVKKTLAKKFDEFDRIDYQDYDPLSNSIWMRFTGKEQQDVKGIEFHFYQKYKESYALSNAQDMAFLINQEWAKAQLDATSAQP